MSVDWGILAITFSVISGFAAVFVKTWNSERHLPTNWGWLIITALFLSLVAQINNYRDQTRQFDELVGNVKLVESIVSDTRYISGELTKGIKKVESQVDTVSSAANSLSGSIERVENSVGNVQGEIDKVQGQVKNVSNSAVRLENSINNISDTVELVKGYSKNIERATSDLQSLTVFKKLSPVTGLKEVKFGKNNKYEKPILGSGGIRVKLKKIDGRELKIVVESPESNDNIRSVKVVSGEPFSFLYGSYEYYLRPILDSGSHSVVIEVYQRSTLLNNSSF